MPETVWLSTTFCCGCSYNTIGTHSIESLIITYENFIHIPPPPQNELDGGMYGSCLKLLDFLQIFVADAPIILLGHTVQNHYISYHWFLELPGTPIKTMSNIFFTNEVFGIKIGWKGCVKFISEEIFGIYLRKKILVLNYFKDWSKFDAFFRPSTLETEN